MLNRRLLHQPTVVVGVSDNKLALLVVVVVGGGDVWLTHVAIVVDNASCNIFIINKSTTSRVTNIFSMSHLFIKIIVTNKTSQPSYPS